MQNCALLEIFLCYVSSQTSVWSVNSATTKTPMMNTPRSHANSTHSRFHTSQANTCDLLYLAKIDRELTKKNSGNNNYYKKKLYNDPVIGRDNYSSKKTKVLVVQKKTSKQEKSRRMCKKQFLFKVKLFLTCHRTPVTSCPSCLYESNQPCLQKKKKKTEKGG